MLVEVYDSGSVNKAQRGEVWGGGWRVESCVCVRGLINEKGGAPDHCLPTQSSLDGN